MTFAKGAEALQVLDGWNPERTAEGDVHDEFLRLAVPAPCVAVKKEARKASSSRFCNESPAAARCPPHALRWAAQSASAR